MSSAQGETTTDRTRARLILTGSLTLLLLILAGSYFIGRAAAREVAVARLQADFVASVSHEFRTPITALRQLSELLEGGRVASDEDRNEYYRALARESERMHRLVEGLLNFGRLQSGALHYRFERLDAIDLVQSVVVEFRRDVEARGYSVELATNGSRPAISADRAALGCAVSNLLENAVKYSPDCCTVWVEVGHESERTVAVRVRDRGIGIPQAEQKQIFEKFVRGAAAKSGSIRGAGVGLAMARQIVEAHHGEIRLESRPGEGSTFTLLLPEAS
jgi:signal transduction histidine kinase